MRTWLIFLMAAVPCSVFAQIHPQNDRVFSAMGFPATPFAIKAKNTLLVAVVDGALDTAKANMSIPLYQNPRELPNGKDDDGNGLVDDLHGWDFADNDGDITHPAAQHGQVLHANAVVSLLYESLYRLVGNAVNEVQLLPIKTKSDAARNNYLPEGYKGIAYALEQGADVIVCAWSGEQFSDLNQALLDKVAAAGTILVGSSGNFLSLIPSYPGAYEPVINVAATDIAGAKLPNSNYGRFIDCAAIGDSVYHWQNEAGYNFNGSSAATAIVAGVMAAVKMVMPGCNALMADMLVKNTALPLEKTNALYTGNLGAGMLQAGLLLRFAIDNQMPMHPSWHAAKGYISLAAAAGGANVSPSGKYPSIMLRPIFIQGKHSASGSQTTAVKKYLNGAMTDTTINPGTKVQDILIAADSFTIKPEARRLPKDSWIYYEVQPLDSSLMYCKGTVYLTAKSGELEDGSGPANYSGRSNCQWQLKAPAGKRIKLEVLQLDTEPKLDFLYVFNGTGTADPILAMLSGTGPIPTITSWSNEVLLWFVTNETIHGQGWKIRWEVVD